MIIEIAINDAVITIPNADKTLVINLKKAITSWENRTYNDTAFSYKKVKTHSVEKTNCGFIKNLER